MPKMNVPWSFKPFDGRMYHTGLQDVEERHVKIALAQGATFVTPPETKAKQKPAEVQAEPVAEVTPKKPQAERKPNTAMAEFNQLLADAKAKGYTGSRKKEDVLAFLGKQEGTVKTEGEPDESASADGS